MASKIRIVLDGAVAGLIGGAVIAIWFFVFDAVRGHPFQTPELLAVALLNGGHFLGISQNVTVLVAEYAVAHFLAFAIIGVIGALLLAASQRDSELFGTLFIFVIAFEVFFIAVIMLAGPAAEAAMPWWKVIIGNITATAAMLAFFFWRQQTLARNLMGPWIDVVREGITAGLIGGVIVAIWFLAYDLALGQPFHTPALLGALIFNGMYQPAGFAVSTGLVLSYTALHFFAFMLFGVAASITMAASEREPVVALGVVVLFLWFELCFVAFVTFLDQTAVQDIGWWNIIGGNITALTAIIAFYEHRHPRMIPRIIERWDTLKTEGRAETTPGVRGGARNLRGL